MVSAVVLPYYLFFLIAVHSNCSESDQCTQYLSITFKNHVLTIQPDLHISWDGHIYTVAQVRSKDKAGADGDIKIEVIHCNGQVRVFNMNIF